MYLVSLVEAADEQERPNIAARASCRLKCIMAKCFEASEKEEEQRRELVTTSGS